MTNERKQTVVVLGASPKPERYSNKAVRLLMEKGHTVVPVHPAISEVEGLEVVKSPAAVQRPVDTLTMYVSAKLSTPLADEIVGLKPGRVIFNPGTENPALQERLVSEGVAVEEACTLILLNTDQF